MNLSLLARRNLAHYWRTNIAVVLGVAAAVAVLSGALMVGDSVRGSLRDLVAQRLGRTDYVISTMLFFREALAKDIPSSTPLIAIEGVAVHDADKRASSAQVYGVDDRFWKFHGVTAEVNAGSDAGISSALASEIGPVMRERVEVFGDHLRGSELVRNDHVRHAALGDKPVAALMPRFRKICERLAMCLERGQRLAEVHLVPQNEIALERDDAIADLGSLRQRAPDQAGLGPVVADGARDDP